MTHNRRGAAEITRFALVKKGAIGVSEARIISRRARVRPAAADHSAPVMAGTS